MNASFYTAALGTGSQQAKINVIANNIANVNTIGYKSKSSVFTELMYRNMDRGAGGVRLQAGSGMKMNSVNTDFSGSTHLETGREYDFAIAGDDGFFMVQDPANGQISYTRNGHFSLSRSGEELYLVTDSGKRVMNRDREVIVVDVELESSEDEDWSYDSYEDDEEETVQDKLQIGVFDFPMKDGMQSVGESEFVPVAKNGEPVLMENAELLKGKLEQSGVDFAKEMSKLVETQRAYSYALKMLQTSDEVESMINSLR